MVTCYLTFGSIFVQVVAGGGVGHLPISILFVLGSLLFVLGTMVRRSLSVREDSSKPPIYQPWARTVSAEKSRRSMANVRSQETSRTSANAA